jgi:hypothetical protein
MASKLLHGTAAVLLALAAACPAAADPLRARLASASPEELKRVYLDCDRAATRSLLDLAVAAHCSMVGEELKHRVFGGDFDRLIAWWREHKLPSSEAVSDAHPREDEAGAP